MDNFYVELIPYLLGIVAGGGAVALINAWCRIARMRSAREVWQRQATPIRPLPMPPYPRNYHPWSSPVWVDSVERTYY